MRWGKAPATDVDDEEETRIKIGVSLGIFFVSLFAVSFPSLTKRVKALRVPSVVFFLGKHFGTGVILSTAFVHLLPDAFGQYRSKWTGFVILGSLLSIFFVEYVTTAYVDYLHSYSSAPPSPSDTPSPSLSRSPSRSRRGRTAKPHRHAEDCDEDAHSCFGVDLTERTPLLTASTTSPTPADFVDADDGRGVVAQAQTVAVPVLDLSASHHSQNHHHQHNSNQHQCDHEALHSQGQSHDHTRHNSIKSEEELEQTEEAIFAGSHHRYESRGVHAHHSLGKGTSRKIAAVVLYDEGETAERVSHVIDGKRKKKDSVGTLGDSSRQSRVHSHGDTHHHSKSHSHHAHGHAHLDMESWDPDVEGISSEGDNDTEEQVRVGRRRQIVGILMLQIGIMLHSLVIGLTLSVSVGSEFTSLVTAILFHQLFEGLSLGIRIAGLPSKHLASPSNGDPPATLTSMISHAMKPLLAVTFALTTPLGIWIGLAVFDSSRSSPNAPHEGHSPLGETQSLLSALSAGMLIYAACVEMLAADFVMDQMMWRSPMRRQVMALIAVAVGVTSMSMVG